MSIPFVYNVRSVRIRWASTSIAILGIAGVVAVFVAMLSLAKGFQLTLVESGSPRNAMIRRGGSTSEMDSVVDLDQLHIIADTPQVARGVDGRPLASGETVVVAAFHHKASSSDALAQVRGVSERALQVHDGVKVAEGRFFQPGLAELVVGKNAHTMYSGFDLGSTTKFGGQIWKVVGIMDARGSAFDSEVWCDQRILAQTYKRPENIFSSVTVRLTDPKEIGALRKTLEADPRMNVQVSREVDYYAKQSQAVSTMIRILGFMVASVMGIGAVFGALNTMYSAVAARSRELATLRALGFSGRSVLVSLLFESLFISLLGGILGCAVVLPVNGLTTSTINWQTFSQLAFAFRVTPPLLAEGILFAVFMGLLSGVLPALRAARLPIATALREL
jgi:putative ABC transport system permease protein